MRDLLRAIAALEPSRVEGMFWRHCSLRWPELEGSFAGGRWNRPNTYPAVYLGRPPDSVIVEAYRHLVDDEMDQTPEIAAELVVERKFLRCAVAVQNIVDLRPARAADAVGLSSDDLLSDVGDYEPCWRVAAAAHQLGFHGVLAPAATGLGETLGLFTDVLPVEQTPEIVETVIWQRLPADPRRLRALGNGEGAE